jgi:hypothetical protein
VKLESRSPRRRELHRGPTIHAVDTHRTPVLCSGWLLGAASFCVARGSTASPERTICVGRSKLQRAVSCVRHTFTFMTREQELVQLLRSRDQSLAAVRDLAGGLTATELRSAEVSAEGYDALVEGLHDESPRVRWWCVQILDHIPDARAPAAIGTVLGDPVARVRRNAAHALGCIACKPSWQGVLPDRVVQQLTAMAESDPNDKVRNEAALTLARRPR